VTLDQYWQWAPVIGLAALGLLFVLYGVFQKYIDCAFAWFDRKPIWVFGLFLLGIAAAMAALVLI